MTKKKAGGPQVYDSALKIAVAREYLTSHLGYSKVGKKYGISADTVKYIVKWYRKNSLTLEASAQPAEDSHTDLSPLELARQLKEANLKITALEMLYENASKEAGFDILKKLGAKQ